ncbi:aminodeoxychorismate synthase component I [Clostridium sp.]|uniref:aminodeoxychorismate synthase component I n=1 Tax=Clostridium sp. TaxID=1506 RepID=UPI003992F6A6
MELLMREIKSNLKVNEVYEIWKDKKDTIMLDSSKEESEYSKFSFIGINPFIKIKSKENLVYLNENLVNKDVFELLNETIESFSIDENLRKEIPFISGAIGYFSYDMGRALEHIEESAIKDYEVYDSYFLFFHNLIIFDLLNDKIYITSLYEDKILSKNSLDYIEDKIINYKFEENNEKHREVKENNLKSNFSKDEYIKAVDKMKDYIVEGHIYIANMTQRFLCDYEEDGYEIYKKLRKINKAPFSAYLNLEDIEIMSSSPERFLKVLNSKVETRPIKGTRPRGRNKEEDELNKKELLNSEKDKSELLMIVDLERNDLSKVCKANSIKVTELFKLEQYDTVFHLVSTVIGELEEEESSVSCIKACFPGGSITGTPKIRAMEIIEELEGVRRGVYTGAIGYFDLRGNCDFNIVIRTILKKGNQVSFGVGGGITIESLSEMEYYETLDKAKALIEVLK